SAGYIRSLVCRPDGTLIYIDGAGRIHVWDLSKAPPAHEIVPGLSYPAGATIAADGAQVASVDKDHAIQLWDIVGDKLQARGKPEKQPAIVSLLLFSPNGRKLAVACDDPTLRLWDLTRGQSTKISTQGKCYIKAVAFAPDGKNLAFGGAYFTNSVFLLDPTD